MANINKNIGSISILHIFHFTTKHLTSGDGGLVCCKDDEKLLKKLRWFGFDRDLKKIEGAIWIK